MQKGDCDGCKKPATVHIQEISGGKIVEKHYCENCPKLQGEHLAKPHAPINELLTNFVLAHSGAGQTGSATCESCGMTWADFKQGGLLGCPNDYAIFEKDLTPVIQRAHEGATHHVGKTPARRQTGAAPATVAASNPPAQQAKSAPATSAKKAPDLAKLRRELQKAVEDEDYEKAAKLRDQIKSAEAKA